METMQQIRNAHRAACYTKTIKITKVENQEIRTKTVTRTSTQSLKDFAKQAGVLETVKMSHELAQQNRSEATKGRTKLGIQAKRLTRAKKQGKPVPVA